MRSLATVAAFALAAGFAANAQAAPAMHGAEYGDPGVIELGGTLAFQNTNTDFKSNGKQSETLAVLAPQVGYFLSPGIQLIGQLTVGSESIKPKGGDATTATLLGLGVGGAYFVKAGTVMVGPELLLQYQDLAVKFPLGGSSINVTQTGPGGELALVAKMPVGGGGIITAGADYQYLSLSQDAKSGGVKQSDSGTEGAFGTFVGFSVYFGGGK